MSMSEPDTERGAVQRGAKTPKRTVLVVDDEADVVASVKDLLRFDCRVIGATSAAEGLRVLDRESVQVVMSDQRMPEMTGVEFLHKVRTDHPDAIRLLFTAYADMRAVIAAINEGNVYRYITKPWDPDELVTIINDAMQRWEMAAQLQKRLFFEGALRRYLAAPIVEELIRDPTKLKLGGEKREVTVLFFDIAGFTSIAEELPVDELVTLVNGYLDEVVQAIFGEDGTLDKFIGDAVMAFWGAPLTQPDHPLRACRAALDMQRALDRFAKTQHVPLLRSLAGRVGVHTGVAAIGNLGSSTIMSYTVMGDTVNVASRLEHINKFYGTAVIASEETVRLACWPGARELDRVRVTGRSQPLRIFELCEPDRAPPKVALDAYQLGLALYRRREFAAASASFEQARVLGDGRCAAVMARKAAEMLITPPAPDWDGATDFLLK